MSKKIDMLYCCCITEKPESSHILPEFLATLDLNFSTWSDEEQRIPRHTVYTETKEEIKKISEEINSRLPEWEEFGIIVDKIDNFTIKREDWAEVWKKFYQIQRIPPKIVIKPSWLDYDSQEDEVVIEIDPGMSFGTGQHPTTRFCLQMLQQIAANSKLRSFLDAGCGSGILTMTAYKLGFKPITGFDIDPAAIKIASANFAKNHLALEKIQLNTTDLADFTSEQQFDVVCANILAPVLVKNAEKIASLVKIGGKVILAGTLQKEYDDIKRVFTAINLTEEHTFVEKEWQSGLFKKCS